MEKQSKNQLNLFPEVKAENYPPGIGVHVRHCCKIHGCKYGDKYCPIAHGKFPQEGPCYVCWEDTWM